MTEEDGTAEHRASATVLDDLPPSAKLVALILERQGPLTQDGIAEATRLNGSTTVHALDALKDAGLVDAEFAEGGDDRYAYRLSEAARGVMASD